MLIRMEHANITVKSIDEAVRFLKLVFPEFEKRGERETETKRWLHFGTPDTYVALEEVFEEATSDRKTYNDPGTNHIGFVIEDLAALTEKTASEQATCWSRAKDHTASGSISSTVSAMSGNLWNT